MAALNIQIYYRCESCKHASDIHGRGCDCGLLFPVLLLVGGYKDCPNYEYDNEKVKQSIESK